MDELQIALAGLGLSWAEVWALRADRRAGTLVVVAADGRKFTATLVTPGLAPLRRVRAIKEIKPQPEPNADQE